MEKINEKTDELLLSLFDALTDYKNDCDAEAFKDYLVNQAILNAYEDATRQGAFNAVLYNLYHFKENEQEYINRISDETIKKIKKSKKNINKAIEKEARQIFKEEKYPDSIKKDAIETMREKIEMLPAPNGDHDSYDNWHKDLCFKLMDLYQTLNEAFTFGNAQKWVNMTVKYLYAYASLLERMEEFSGNANPFHHIIEQKYNLHVPIDRYIIKAVFNYNTRKDLPKELFQQKSSKDYNYANSEGRLCIEQDKNGNNQLCKKSRDSKYTLTWSKMGSYRDYEYLQNEIKNNIAEGTPPLEWENKVWLQMAMKS